MTCGLHRGQHFVKKPNPIIIKALLDSGGSESLINAKFCTLLQVWQTKGAEMEWESPGRNFTTKAKVKA